MPLCWQHAVKRVGELARLYLRLTYGVARRFSRQFSFMPYAGSAALLSPSSVRTGYFCLPTVQCLLVLILVATTWLPPGGLLPAAGCSAAANSVGWRVSFIER